MKRWTFQLLNLTLLLSPFASAQAASSTAPSLPAPVTQAEICDAPEVLLEVHVGAVTRGTVITRSVGSDIWLDPSVFRDGEAGYHGDLLNCGNQTYVQLDPALSPHVDPERLTLTFQPAPQTLAAQAFSVSAPKAMPAEAAPLTLLNYAVAADHRPGQDLRVTGTLQLALLKGGASAAVAGNFGVDAGALWWFPSAQLGWQMSPSTTLQLVYNTPYLGSVVNSAATASRFSGASLRVNAVEKWTWPSLTLTLPFPAHLRVMVNGQTVAEYDAAAGPLTMRDIPLLGPQGWIEVQINDETGRRSVTQAYRVAATLVAPRTYSVSADGGVLDGTFFSTVTARYGLTPTINLEGQFQSRINNVRARVEADFVQSESFNFSVGGAYTSESPTPLSVTGSATFALAPFSVYAMATVPVRAPEQSQIGLGLVYSAGNHSLIGQASLDASGLQASLEGNVNMSPQLAIQPALKAGRGGWGAALKVTYQPTPTVHVQASGGTAGARLNAQYQWRPGSRLWLTSDLHSAALGVQAGERTQLNAAVNTAGQAQATVRGSAFFGPAGVTFGKTNDRAAYVTLETGIGNMRIFADGVFKGTTDAVGRLVFGVTPGEAVRVSVDDDSVPFHVMIGEKSTELNIPGPGSYRLDWQGNFRPLYFVAFSWKEGQPAVNARIILESGEVIFTDALGNASLTKGTREQKVQLLSEDGQQGCNITLPVDGTSLMCNVP